MNPRKHLSIFSLNVCVLAQNHLTVLSSAFLYLQLMSVDQVQFHTWYLSTPALRNAHTPHPVSELIQVCKVLLGTTEVLAAGQAKSCYSTYLEYEVGQDIVPPPFTPPFFCRGWRLKFASECQYNWDRENRQKDRDEEIEKEKTSTRCETDKWIYITCLQKPTFYELISNYHRYNLHVLYI